ncbi:metallophosphoesterase family protein [Terasakiella pusilla]|uniref:metallophosphoesterase family protein n=1 Tax=Terasakiella pusilla TaxID=64973 RepID=UPI003AA7B63D
MRAFLKKILDPKKEKSHHLKDAQTSENTRIFAIGDIHGRADLLQKMLKTIFHEICDISDKKENKIVFLGDYIDRGNQSYEVLEILTQPAPRGIEYVFIKGNHEEILLNFLKDPTQNSSWFQHGGAETLLSYKVSMDMGKIDKNQLKGVAKKLKAALPEVHKKFLISLLDSYEDGNYYFTHAGIDPNLPLTAQKNSDLRWIRDKFINHTSLYEKIIVHGHTITKDVQLLKNRIAVDTGAYYSGKLSCIVLDGQTKRVLQT